jgi:hypothetical protein
MNATPFAHPAFELLTEWLPDRDRPDAAKLNTIIDRLARKPSTHSSRLPVRFEVAHGRKQTALDYERSIQDTGRVPLRPHDWHDAFNALCWIAWPNLKAEMNAVHTLHAARSGAQRGRVRDILTLLDESGVIVLSRDPELSALLLAKKWKALFFERRDDVIRHVRFLVCGHGLYDKLREPYRSIAGRALIVPSQPVFLEDSISVESQRHYADGRAASIVSGHLDVPAQTVAFPLCAIPGWWPGNDRADFYDDASIFRPAGGSVAPASEAIDSTSASTDGHSALAPAPVSSPALP